MTITRGNKNKRNWKKVFHKWPKSVYERRRNNLLAILKPGDHIAAERKRGGIIKYEHHGIYKGLKFRPNGTSYPSVVHFQGPATPEEKSSAAAAAPALCSYNCEYVTLREGGVVTSCIDCFSKKKKMYKMQYEVRNKLLSPKDRLQLNLKRGKVIAGYRSLKYYREYNLDGKLYGHSEVLSSIFKTVEHRLRYYKVSSSDRSAEEVLKAAYHSEFKPYSLCCNNCEHFAVFSKTGSSRSIQVEKLPIVTISCANGAYVDFHIRPGKGKQGVGNRRINPSREEVGSSEPMQVDQMEEPGEGSEQEKEPLISAKRRKTS